MYISYICMRSDAALAKATWPQKNMTYSTCNTLLQLCLKQSL